MKIKDIFSLVQLLQSLVPKRIQEEPWQETPTRFCISFQAPSP